ncbi:MAG: hypothetical protein GY845_30035 [Planctomycetes bacterium]|nr:hypothetical protein [Planctomycetota bacterium]
MTLGLRKIILLVLIGSVFLMANVVVVANWLSDKGVSEFAQTIRNNYLTGTAITIVVALLILLANPKNTSGNKVTGFIRRCPVCDKALLSRGNYCSECGSKV